MTDLSHRPSGQMCMACANNSRDCSALSSATMPPMRRDRDGTVVVRCSEFNRAQKEEP